MIFTILPTENGKKYSPSSFQLKVVEQSRNEFTPLNIGDLLPSQPLPRLIQLLISRPTVDNHLARTSMVTASCTALCNTFVTILIFFRSNHLLL